MSENKNETTDLAPYLEEKLVPKSMSVFGSAEGFELAQRMAACLAKSDLVPKEYRGNIPNCMLALNMSQRLNADPLMVMQNLYIVYGRPGWSSQFLIAGVNTCGRFSPLTFRFSGEKGSDDRTCVAVATNLSTGDILEGPEISIRMAKAEGWYNRKSKEGNAASKWPTLPELMLTYRAATYFARVYAPEITMGMHTQDEIEDIGYESAKPVSVNVLEAGTHNYGRKKQSEQTPTEDETKPASGETKPAETEQHKPAAETKPKRSKAQRSVPAF